MPAEYSFHQIFLELYGNNILICFRSWPHIEESIPDQSDMDYRRYFCILRAFLPPVRFSLSRHRYACSWALSLERPPSYSIMAALSWSHSLSVWFIISRAPTKQRKDPQKCSGKHKLLAIVCLEAITSFGALRQETGPENGGHFDAEKEIFLLICEMAARASHTVSYVLFHPWYLPAHSWPHNGFRTVLPFMSTLYRVFVNLRQRTHFTICAVYPDSPAAPFTLDTR